MYKSVEKTKEFKVGDKVKIEYISDTNPLNGKVGEITWINKYNFYIKGNKYNSVEKYQAKIVYPNGKEISISDLYREGSGVVSPIEKVEIKETIKENCNE